MKPLVVRLNAKTFPMKEKERGILASAGAEVLETELPDGCRELPEADAIMIVSAYLREPLIKTLKKCRIISRIGTGCDKIDIARASEQGIMVTNVPSFAAAEVADHTMALLLSAARQLKPYEKAMRSGFRPGEISSMRRLSTQTLGIFGFGHIGQAVAARAKAFGMKIIVCDPRASAGKAKELGAELSDKDTIIKSADYICLLCPLMPSTKWMLSMPEFKAMRRDAVLINTGRGELVNEKDLIEALKSGLIRWAGLDVFGEINVFSESGFDKNHPFFSLENVQLTPHVAANSREALEEAHSQGAQAVADVLGGKAPLHIVNQDYLKKGL